MNDPNTNPKPNPNILFTPRMLCKLLSISRRTLRYWVEKGLLPEPLRLGPDGRTLRWHSGDVVDCLRRTGRAGSANQGEQQVNGD